MQRLLIAAAAGAFAFVAAAPAFALDPNARTTAQPNQKVDQSQTSPEETGSIDRVVLEKGENSFTQGQAKSRIEGAGFTNVSTLVLNDQGIWRGTANKGAMTMNIGLDYRGNIAADNAKAQ